MKNNSQTKKNYQLSRKTALALLVLVILLMFVSCEAGKRSVVCPPCGTNRDQLVDTNIGTVVKASLTELTKEEDETYEYTPEPVVSVPTPSETPSEPVTPVIPETPAEPEVPEVTPEPKPEPHVHNYALVEEVAAGEWVEGKRVYRCECGDEYSEAIPALPKTVCETIEKQKEVVVATTYYEFDLVDETGFIYQHVTGVTAVPSNAINVSSVTLEETHIETYPEEVCELVYPQ